MLNLLRKDIKEYLTNKKLILGLFFVLIITIISTYYNINKQAEGQSEELIGFGVVNLDTSSYSKLLVEYFSKSESFSSYVRIVEGTEEEIEQRFLDNKLDIYLVIPEGFAENMIYLEHLPVKVVINSTDTTKAILLKNILESYEKYIRAVEINCVALYDSMSASGMDDNLINEKNIEISYDLIFTALGKEAFFRYEESADFPMTSIFNYYFMAILTMFLFFICLLPGSFMMLEKSQGTLKRLRSIGTSIGLIISAKIILFSIIIFFVSYSIYIITLVLLKQTFSVKTLFLFFTETCIFVSLAILLSGFIKRVKNYMIVGNIMIFVLSILGGAIIPIMYMPSSLSNFSKLTPNYWFIKGILLLQKGVETDLIKNLNFINLFCSSLFFILSCLVYKKKEVCYEE